MSKKLIIKSGDLPDIISGETQIFVRYRVVSEDKNRVSAWTPIFSVTPTIPYVNNITQITNDITQITNDITLIEGDVVNLYNISDDNFALSVVL